MTAFYTDVALSSASDNWSTPRWLVDQLAAEFGPFSLDPAASAENAKAPAFYTADDDGLSQPWTAHCVFLNPPYGRDIGAWIDKAIAEVERGNAGRVVMVVPARVDTAWWRRATAASSLVRIWPGRIEFGAGGRAPFASAVIVFGRLPGRHGTRHRLCDLCGRVFWPAQRNRITCSDACRRQRSRTRLRVRDI